MTWLLSLLSTWLSFQIVTSCASMDHCVPGWRQCGKAQDQARWKLVPLIESLKGENDFSEDSQKEAKDLSMVFCPSPDQLFSRISPLLQSTTIRQTVHLEKYGNHYLALLSISGIFDISPQQPHPLKDEYRCGKYTYKRCALAPQLCLWTVIFPLKLSFLYIREGVKKNGFFGTLSQTSAPTHPPRMFGTPLSEKLKLGLFCFLGCLEHFFFLKKWEIFRTKFHMYLFETLDRHPYFGARS